MIEDEEDIKRKILQIQYIIWIDLGWYFCSYIQVLLMTLPSEAQPHPPPPLKNLPSLTIKIKKEREKKNKKEKKNNNQSRD